MQRGWGDEEMNSAYEDQEYSDDRLTDAIIRCIIKVHKILGPGFRESIYGNALAIELGNQEILFEREKEVRVYYEREQVGLHRLDFLIAGEVVLEVKAVESLGGAHYAQVRSYVKAAGVSRGLLANFATEKADFRRIEI